MHILRAKKRTRAKVVFDVHGVSPEETEMSGGHVNRVKRLEEWEKEALTTADLRVFVSNRMHDFFNAKYGLSGLPYIVIPCCVHSERFQMTEETRSSKRNQLGINNKFVFLYVGTLSVWQWPEAMFSLFAQFYRERPDSLFYLLLPNSDHEKATFFLKKHQLPPTSFIVDEVPHDEVGSVIGVVDAGLLLRKSHAVNYVSFPTKFGEYLAAGIPVISTQEIGDTSSLIKNQKVGLVISPKDDGLNQKDLNSLLQLADDVKKQRAEWSNRCMRVARQTLEWLDYGMVMANGYKKMS